MHNDMICWDVMVPRNMKLLYQMKRYGIKNKNINYNANYISNNVTYGGQERKLSDLFCAVVCATIVHSEWVSE